MKKRIIGMILAMAIIFSAFIVPVSAATKLELNLKTAVMGVGEDYTLKATTNSPRSITWSSSSKAVAAVNKSGVVTGKKAGKTTITATVDGVKAACTVTVKKAPDKVSAKAVAVNVSETAKIKVTLPKDTASKTLTFKSSDIKIAKVNSVGVVTGVKAGMCTVTIKTFNGKSTKVKVTVSGVSQGNTSGNISNGGIAAQSGGWVYYSNQGLYKVKTDGTGSKKLCNDNARYINVVGSWIYYRDYSGEGLYKIKTDGTGRQKLCNGKVVYINVAGSWIYYSATDNDGLYKIKTDGTGKKKLCNDSAGDIKEVNGWIYYFNTSDEFKLYKIKTDGTGKEKLNEDYMHYVNVIGDMVYYVNHYKNGKYLRTDGLYKMKIDGTGREKLHGDEIGAINVEGDWIYYQNVDDGFKLYKMKTDGTGKVKLCDDGINYINVVGSWIYYISQADDFSKLFRIKTDGTQRQEVK